MNGDLSVLVTALIALGGMTWLMRWVFRPARSRRRVVVPGDATPGLLEPVANGVTRTEGMSLRAVLGDANIRSSMSNRRDGRVDIFVFRDDLAQAQRLLPPGTH